MKIDQHDLKEKIINLLKKWDLSSHTYMSIEDKLIIAYDYGYNDREYNLAKDPSSPYVYHWEDPFFIGLCVLKLIDDKLIGLKDTLDCFIPEYEFSEKITIFNMLKNNSGIKDFFHNDLMVDLEQSSVYKASSREEQLVQEIKMFHQNNDFETVMKCISKIPLEYAPGTEDKDYSSSNTPILAEVVRRVSGQSIFSFLTDFIFKPLAMTSVKKGFKTSNVSYTVYEDTHMVRLEDMSGVDDLFTMMPEDIHKLTHAFCKKEIYSQKLWREILKFDKENFGLVFDNTNGIIIASTQCFGFKTIMYFKPDFNIVFASVANEGQKMVNENATWEFLSKDLRTLVCDLITYPHDTKMKILSKKNFWQAKALTVSAEQNKYVLDAKTSIGMASVYKSKKAYVQMEGDTAVGLLVLDIEPKKDTFSIDIILIDEKYQGRGYGKRMLAFAVDKLTQAGAKKLSIGVARANLAAKQLYLNAGFKPHSIYPEGMELQLDIEQHK